MSHLSLHSRGSKNLSTSWHSQNSSMIAKQKLKWIHLQPHLSVQKWMPGSKQGPTSWFRLRSLRSWAAASCPRSYLNSPSNAIWAWIDTIFERGLKSKRWWLTLSSKPSCSDKSRSKEPDRKMKKLTSLSRKEVRAGQTLKTVTLLKNKIAAKRRAKWSSRDNPGNKTRDRRLKLSSKALMSVSVEENWSWEVNIVYNIQPVACESLDN